MHLNLGSIAVLFFTFFLSLKNIQAYPSAYRRLYRQSDGRTIDLISDVHLSEPGEHKTEKALIEKFVAIDATAQEPIDFFYETIQDIKLPKKSWLDWLGGLAITSSSDQDCFIAYGIEQLKKIKKINLILRHSDSYRADVATLGALLSGDMRFLLHATPADFLGSVAQVVKNIHPIDEYLGHIENMDNALVFNTLWAAWKQGVLHRYDRCKKANALELSLCNLDKAQCALLVELCSYVVSTGEMTIVDFELLCNLLNSGKRHAIVYAGGAHCRSVGVLLCRFYGFSEQVHKEGDLHKAIIAGYSVDLPGPLKSDTWSLLAAPAPIQSKL